MSNYVFIFSFKRQTGENHEKSFNRYSLIFGKEVLKKYYLMLVCLFIQHSLAFFASDKRSLTFLL